MALSGSNLVQKLKDIVVVGDGPMAMLTVLELSKMGARHITLLGPRLDDFSRSGHFVDQVISNIGSFLHNDLFSPRTHQIKSIERELYKLVQAQKITIIKKKFVNFSKGRNLIIANSDGTEQELIHADMVFDGTGTKRAVINAYNKFSDDEAPKFTIEEYQDEALPKKYVYVRGAALRRLVNASYATPTAYTLASMSLLSVGWDKKRLPRFYGYDMYQKNSLVKVNLYMEVKPEYTEEQIKKSLNIMMKMSEDDAAPLNTSNPKKSDPSYFEYAKESKKHAEKRIINHVNALVSVARPGLVPATSETPLVMHVGDASGNLPFVTAMGIRLGIGRLKKMFECFDIGGGIMYQVAIDAYNIQYEKQLKVHKKEFNEWVRQIKNNNQEQEILANLELKYHLAMQCHPSKRPIVRAAQKRLEDETNKLLAKCLFEFIQINSDMDKVKDNEERYHLLIKKLPEFFANVKRLCEKRAKSPIAVDWKKLAVHCVTLGDYFLNETPHNLLYAKKLYEYALDAYGASYLYINFNVYLAIYDRLIHVSQLQDDTEKLVYYYKKAHHLMFTNSGVEPDTTIRDSMYTRVAEYLLKRKELGLDHECYKVDKLIDALSESEIKQSLKERNEKLTEIESKAFTM